MELAVVIPMVVLLLAVLFLIGTVSVKAADLKDRVERVSREADVCAFGIASLKRRIGRSGKTLTALGCPSCDRSDISIRWYTPEEILVRCEACGDSSIYVPHKDKKK